MNEQAWYCWWRTVEHMGGLLGGQARAYWRRDAELRYKCQVTDNDLHVLLDAGNWAKRLVGLLPPDQLDYQSRIDVVRLCALFLSLFSTGDIETMARALKTFEHPYKELAVTGLQDLEQNLHAMYLVLTAPPHDRLHRQPDLIVEAQRQLDDFDRWRLENTPLPFYLHFAVIQLIEKWRAILRREQRLPAPVAQDEIRKFLERAGFEVREITGRPHAFLCSPDTDFWQKNLPNGLVVQAFYGADLSSSGVFRFGQTVKEQDAEAHHALGLREHDGIPNSAWYQIQAFDTEGLRLIFEPIWAVREASEPFDLMRSWLSPVPDPFDESRAVVGEHFFGRIQTLADFEKKLAEGRRIVGLFGLRKMGKTSLLHQLRRVSPFPIAIVNLQEHGEKPLKDLMWALLKACADAVNKKCGFDPLPELGTSSSGRPIEDDVTRILDRMEQQSGARYLVLCLDEIETIVPSAQDQGPKADRFIGVTGPLRALVERDDRLRLVVVGLNPDIGQRSVCGGKQNPFFQQIAEFWLQPMNAKECCDMITLLGQRGWYKFAADSLQRIYQASGGHPYLARRLCSLVVSDNLNSSLVMGGGTALDARVARAVDCFVDNAEYASYLSDSALLGEVGNPQVWGPSGGEPALSVLERLAEETQPLSRQALVRVGDNAAVIHDALDVLVERGVVRQEGDGTYRIAFGLLHSYIRSRKERTVP